MTSIFALSALFCFYLCAQAPAQGALTKLIRISREDLDDQWRLSADFESTSPVQVSWWKHGMPRPTAPSSAFEEVSGTASWVLPKAGLKPYTHIYLRLGELPAHYIRVRWNLDGAGNKTLELNYPMATIVPGTELVYTPGQPLTVTVKVPETRGNGVIDFYNHFVYPTGYYMRPDGSMHNVEDVPFLRLSWSSGSLVTTTVLTFQESGSATINGYFTANMGGQPHELGSSLMKEFDEIIVFTVHDADKDPSDIPPYSHLS